MDIHMEDSSVDSIKQYTIVYIKEIEKEIRAK